MCRVQIQHNAFIKKTMPRSEEGWTFFLAQAWYTMPDLNVAKQAYLASCETRCHHETCLPLLTARVTQAPRHRCDSHVSVEGNNPDEEIKIGVDSEDGEDWKAFILGPKYKKRVFPPKKREREEKDK